MEVAAATEPTSSVAMGEIHPAAGTVADPTALYQRTSRTSQPDCIVSLLVKAEASVSEEPGAVIPHAGICAGGVR